MARSASQRPTSFDIAYRAGVSQPTVSRALRGSPSVSAATRARIEAIARELNYAVDKNASNLRSQQSHTIALLFFEDVTADSSLINPFFLSMLGAITRGAGKAGYDLLISFQHHAGDCPKSYEDSRKADGIILLGYGDYQQYRPRLEQLYAQGTHFVRWGSPEHGDRGTTIGCDNRAGGRVATEHLLHQGRRRIGFLGACDNHSPEFRERWLGYCDAHHAAGIEPDPALQVDAITLEAAGHRAVHTLTARGGAFDAIFAASDLIAIGAMHALQESGKRIPNDIAVVGYDDIPAAHQASPPLTTVQQDAQLAGDALVNALLARLEQREPVSCLLPVSLKVRASSVAHTTV
ncbi:LacI family DNA-binding transcriptional regulator [Sphingomonas qomolangmaensis]|uniref:LacI family DNA-binding transcriptional regulator n=1 Tax=Sphingomonas qomolangmaensis TaxID=2918765 RepID=A0ABY5L6B0_9SPHN|nr:LacI family DNA-binding transcriptional regulator [Sphingomonas qomolangmaensis]UUL82490.1 LacI family DNA-binding transcriptional regulator [Sphingomonas qomolangmaensis]